jgi:Na+/melibiose symporter-like transporter
MLGTIINPSAANWIVSLVPAHIRGRYMGLREGIMIATLTVTSVVMGLVIDHMKSIGNEAMGYFVCTIVILVFTVLNFLCLINIKEPPPKISRGKITLKKIITKPFHNHHFRKVLILTAMWSFGLQIGGPYFSIYFYSVLGLNYTYIMLMNVLMYAMRVFAAQLWGRLADKTGWVNVTKLSLAVLGIVHTGFIFMNENTYMWVYPLLQAFSGIGWGGIAISMFNIQFEYAPEENRTSYVSVNTAISSIAGFGAILLASLFVKLMGNSTVYLGSMPIHNMQYLLFASGILILLTALYVHKVIKVKR